LRNGFTIERPARGRKKFVVPPSVGKEGTGLKAGLPTKKPPDPGKTENEGIQRILAKTVRQAGLILLFDGEVD